VKYRLSARAVKDIERADRWWREHRPEAPDALRDEVQAAIAQLLTAPRSGVAWGTRSGETVRRVVMPDIERVLYYALDDETVVVLSVVGTRRGRQPRFGRSRS
jgi:plasmid stabilization system protein ParE